VVNLGLLLEHKDGLRVPKFGVPPGGLFDSIMVLLFIRSLTPAVRAVTRFPGTAQTAWTRPTYGS